MDGELLICLLLVLIVVLPLVPTFIALKESKKKVPKEFERTDPEKHRYYPIIFSKSAKVAIFFVLLAVCCFVLPILPVILIHLVFPQIKFWMAILICEFIGAMLIFIYYRFLVFDIDYIELDKKSLEIVHTSGKRELYSLATYENFYENTYRMKYSTGITRGLIFDIAGKKTQVNLDFLGDEGFVIFNADLQALLKTGNLPVVQPGEDNVSKDAPKETQGEEVSVSKAEPEENFFEEKKDEEVSLNPDGYDYFIFVKNASKENLTEALNDYGGLYISDMLFAYVTGMVLGTPWNYTQLLPAKIESAEELLQEYFNILLWLKDQSSVLFAYAIPKDSKDLPIYVTCDNSNPAGDTVKGIMNGRNFTYCVPEMAFEWGKEVPKKFDYKEEVEERFAFRKEYFDMIDYIYRKNNPDGGFEGRRNPHSKKKPEAPKAPAPAAPKEDVTAEAKLEWTMRITDKVINADDYHDFQMNLDEALCLIEGEEEEFVIVEPSIPQKGIAFMQACLDKKSGRMHLEVGLEQSENGAPNILCKDDVSVGECLDLFSDFYEGWNVDTTGWSKLKLE